MYVTQPERRTIPCLISVSVATDLVPPSGLQWSGTVLPDVGPA